MTLLSGVFYFLVKFVYADEPRQLSYWHGLACWVDVKERVRQESAAMSRSSELVTLPLECATLVTPLADVGHASNLLRRNKPVAAADDLYKNLCACLRSCRLYLAKHLWYRKLFRNPNVS